MPIYHALGRLPAKRHVVFRSAQGALYTEELIGNKGFVGAASRVYVVVAVGLTDVLVVPVTMPTPWSIESEVAPVTLQESVELAPGAIEAGDAVNEAITGTGTAVTVTVAVANQGTAEETFQVTLADSLGATVGAPQTVTALAAGASRTLSFAWTPTVTGTQTLTAAAAAVPGEIDTADNAGTATSVVSSAGGTVALDIRVAASADDAEESPAGVVERGSSDLELVDDAGLQTVGVRFLGISIPRGATVVNAYIQFKADEASTAATALNIQGQAADNATTFLSTAYNISSRPRTAASVAWSPPPWTCRHSK